MGRISSATGHWSIPSTYQFQNSQQQQYSVISTQWHERSNTLGNVQSGRIHRNDPRLRPGIPRTHHNRPRLRTGRPFGLSKTTPTSLRRRKLGQLHTTRSSLELPICTVTQPKPISLTNLNGAISCAQEKSSLQKWRSQVNSVSALQIWTLAKITLVMQFNKPLYT